MTKLNIKYILFDFDGTLIDSMPFLENNAVSLLSKYYKFSNEDARKKYRETTGLPFVQQMELIAPNEVELNKKIVDYFEKMKVEKIYEQKPFPDSYKVLEVLRNKGYNLGISSGTIEEIIQEYLNKKNLTVFVDDILGWRPGFEKGKDHFNFILSKYRLINKNIMFCGDSLNDALRAKINGIEFIGMIGMFSQSDFNNILPSCKVISSLNELINDF